MARCSRREAQRERTPPFGRAVRARRQELPGRRWPPGQRERGARRHRCARRWRSRCSYGESAPPSRRRALSLSAGNTSIDGSSARSRRGNDGRPRTSRATATPAATTVPASASVASSAIPSARKMPPAANAAIASAMVLPRERPLPPNVTTRMFTVTRCGKDRCRETRWDHPFHSCASRSSGSPVRRYTVHSLIARAPRLS